MAFLSFLTVSYGFLRFFRFRRLSVYVPLYASYWRR